MRSFLLFFFLLFLSSAYLLGDHDSPASFLRIRIAAAATESAPIFSIPKTRLPQLLVATRTPSFNVDLQVMLLSRYGTHRKRAAVRRVSLALVTQQRAAFDELDDANLTSRALRVAYYFAITQPDDVAEVAELLLENATHGDIYFTATGVDNIDLSRKVWEELRIAAHHGAARWFLKADDDHMIFYDLMLRELAGSPSAGLFWGRRGTGHSGTYTNSAYLMSFDVLEAVSSDVRASTCGNDPGEDYCIGTAAIDRSGLVRLFRDDIRWYNDDNGLAHLCLCAHWLEETPTLVVHHVRPQLMEAWADNRTLFQKMRYPDRNWDDGFG